MGISGNLGWSHTVASGPRNKARDMLIAHLEAVFLPLVGNCAAPTNPPRTAPMPQKHIKRTSSLGEIAAMTNSGTVASASRLWIMLEFCADNGGNETRHVKQDRCCVRAGDFPAHSVCA